MSKPFFSVIVPTHNGEERLHESLESVKKQTFTDYELIVVCDSCDDNSVGVAGAFATSVVVADVHNDGLARNRGLDVATGEWILFLDDDDYFLHEYCFELLAEKLRCIDSDVLDFSFVWKGEGYKVPSPHETFVMAWCRAWRRSFIGDNRFKDIPYGSDKDFYERMIQNNPDVSVTLWNMPMYYYNYMRKGSMTWVNKQKNYLGIIVTHHDEPLEIGRPFFDMLEHQQNADMNHVIVTLVQDGDCCPEGEMIEFLGRYSYDIQYLPIPGTSVGTAQARNYGIEETNAEWITFCNFDDMYADVTAMNLILANFPNNDYDLIWGKYAIETVWCNGEKFINCVDVANYASCANKYYRREFLLEHDLRFSSTAGLHYDYVFNSLVLAEIADHRAVNLTSTNYLYYKRFRPDSIRHTKEGYRSRILSIIERDEQIFFELEKRGKDTQKAIQAYRVICDAYYAIYRPDKQERFDSTESIGWFYAGHKNLLEQVSDADAEVVLDEAETEMVSLIQSIYNETKQEYYFVNDDKSFHEWLEHLASTMEDEPIVAEIPANLKPAKPSRPERIVAYCGTRNVYDDMLTSAKSLLFHTPVDKIYLFTEDNDYDMQEELPPIFNVMNVSGQKVFPPDGPNYKNTWTYMCMIRAIYPTLLSSYSKVLSLDVDTIVQDDISDLWDIDISNAYIAGVPEPQRQKHPDDPIYINFGVVLMNLDKLRQDGKQQEIVDILNRKKVDCPEQGAFNQACAGGIIPIPNDYNVTVYSHITGTPDTEKILHYAGHRFWKHYRSVRRYADMSWEDVMKEQERVRMEESNRNSRNHASKAEDE